MSDNPVTPEALERLEKAAIGVLNAPVNVVMVPRDLPELREHNEFIACATPATILALVASFRTLESDRDATRQALENHIEDTNHAYAYTPGELRLEALTLIEEAHEELAEARAQEGRPDDDQTI